MATKMLAVLALVATSTFGAVPSADAAGAPNTKITKGPSGTVASTTATFSFKAKPKKGATFKCRLDTGRFKKCTSPKKYTGLAQGAHTFAVQAKANGKKDKTPATRSFTVDTVAPETSLTPPPSVTDDHTPTFTFSANDPAATFTCRLGAAAFAPCTSPFTLPATPDEVYTFQVRARDAVGNTDPTPASGTFEILTPLTKDLATAQAAAAYLLPDVADIDIAANCASNPAIDCPGGTPLPPADQIHLTATRSVVEVPATDRYDVTVAPLNVTTLVPVVVTISGNDCSLTVTSANGATPAWQLTASLNFVHPPSSAEWRIQTSNISLSGVDDADLTLTGNTFCQIAASGISFYKSQLIDVLEAQFQVTLCAARGPDYLGPCAS